jgi:hypothetical protein
VVKNRLAPPCCLSTLYVCEPARQLTCGALGGGTGVGRRTKPTEEQAPCSFYLHRQEQGGAVREEYKDCTAPSDAPPTFAHAHLVVRAWVGSSTVSCLSRQWKVFVAQQWYQSVGSPASVFGPVRAHVMREADLLDKSYGFCLPFLSCVRLGLSWIFFR